MLSKKVKSFLVEQGIYYENDDAAYTKVIDDLGIPLDSDFADFNMHTNCITFSGRMYEIYNVCWFMLYSNYDLNVVAAREGLKLPQELIPLDSFEAEGGFFYNRQTGSVVELELGDKLRNFLAGKLEPQWKSFNLFLEWYFELK